MVNRVLLALETPARRERSAPDPSQQQESGWRCLGVLPTITSKRMAVVFSPCACGGTCGVRVGAQPDEVRAATSETPRRRRGMISPAI